MQKRLSQQQFYQRHTHYINRAQRRTSWVLLLLFVVGNMALALLLMLLWTALFTLLSNANGV